MSIAVASVSAFANNENAWGDVTVTAPADIDAGDLLLILVGSSYPDTASSTGFTLGYVHSYNYGLAGRPRVSVLYKIAEVADESAANYTVTPGSSNAGAIVVMFRITGWSVGDPLSHGLNIFQNYIQDGSATLSYSGSAVSRPSQSLAIMYACTDAREDGGFSFASYSATPSITFTEAGDVAIGRNSQNYGDTALAVAYGTTSATTDLTGFSVAKTGDSSDGPEPSIVGIISIFDPVDATGTPGLFVTDAESFGTTGTSDATGNVPLYSVSSPSFNSVIAKATQPTQWSNVTKPTTTWTNDTL